MEAVTLPPCGPQVALTLQRHPCNRSSFSNLFFLWNVYKKLLLVASLCRKTVACTDELFGLNGQDYAAVKGLFIKTHFLCWMTFHCCTLLNPFLLTMSRMIRRESWKLTDLKVKSREMKEKRCVNKIFFRLGSSIWSFKLLFQWECLTCSLRNISLSIY